MGKIWERCYKALDPFKGIMLYSFSLFKHIDLGNM